MQQCSTHSDNSFSIDCVEDRQVSSHPGSETTYSSTFVPKPPSRDQNRLLQRTYSNPDDAESMRLPSLRFGKTMKLPGMTIKSRMLDPIPKANDLDLRFKLTRIHGQEKTVVEPVESALRKQNNGHKKLERSQTAPMALLKPILKTSPDDLRGKMMARASEKRRQQNVYSCRKISEGLKTEVNEPSTASTASPVMRILPNGRKIFSRTFQQGNTLNKSQLQHKSALKLNENTRIDLETFGFDSRSNLLEEEEFKTTQASKDDTNELTYLTFAEERQEENNRI